MPPHADLARAADALGGWLHGDGVVRVAREGRSVSITASHADVGAPEILVCTRAGADDGARESGYRTTPRARLPPSVHALVTPRGVAASGGSAVELGSALASGCAVEALDSLFSAGFVRVELAGGLLIAAKIAPPSLSILDLDTACSAIARLAATLPLDGDAASPAPRPPGPPPASRRALLHRVAVAAAAIALAAIATLVAPRARRTWAVGGAPEIAGALVVSPRPTPIADALARLALPEGADLPADALEEREAAVAALARRPDRAEIADAEHALDDAVARHLAWLDRRLTVDAMAGDDPDADAAYLRVRGETVALLRLQRTIEP